MSLQAIQPFITKQLEALGYKEHIDPFNDEDIPANILDGSFHQLIRPISGADRSNIVQGLSVPVQVKTFLKGFRDPKDGLTQSIIKAEQVIQKMLPPSEYKNNSVPITSVLLDSLTFEPYSLESNDNVIVSVFMFNFIVYICTE